MADEAAYLLADEDAGLLGGVRAQARRRSRKRWALGTTATLCVVAGLSRDRGRLSVWNFAPSVLAPALAPPLLPAGQRCGVPGLRRAEAQGFLDEATRAPGSHRALPYWSKAARVDGCEVHAVTLELRHTHLDELEAAVLAASTPGHARFRQFWTADEVRTLTTDAADAATVEAWLAGLGLEAHATRSGGFVTVRAPVHAIERMFECTMFLWAKTLAGDGSVYRCDGDYSLPAAVYASVHAVYGVAELPVLLGGAKRHVEILDGSDVRGHDRRITPQKLQRFYGIDAEYVYASGPPTRATQALFETIGQEYSPRDLRTFDGFFDLPVHENLTSVGGHVVDRCDDPGDCAEGNLDVQYMTALAPRAPTTFFYVDDDQDFDDPFVLFAMRVSNMEHPPLVTSISYGSLETALVPSVMRSFNVAAMKLALMGATVFVSSGDDGVANVISRASQCAYAPSYPASSPWVVAVGATTTTNDWGARGEGEVVCQSDYEDSVITSGGGFSTVFDAHNYTRPAVDAYLASHAPFPGFRREGRAYPDVALAGYGYEVVIGGDLYAVSGTSCSAPAVAAMASLVNAIRLEAGAPPLGFINPVLYWSRGAFANDVTSGSNHCVSHAAHCCFQGFNAGPGWDPATGFGSVDYGRFEALFLSDLDAATIFAAKARLRLR
ncbi:tripeptidyl-peptidase [Aureococcus anophagefferens]|uniref:subtilisin n=1 Tax=Aureococcus anophagefferens TaxID=44056 RepID=A0ABR1G524_AURAN